MHRSQHLTWISALVVLGVPSLGCRNTNSDGSISVQPQYSSLAERLKGPQARLGSSGRSAADRLENEAGEPKPTSDGSKFSLSDQGNSQSPTENDLTASFSKEEMQVLEEAFANATPEIREIAMRRIAAQRAQESQNNPSSQQSSEKPPADETAVRQAAATESAQGPPVIPTSATTDAQVPESSNTKGSDPNEFEMPDLTGNDSTTSVSPTTATANDPRKATDNSARSSTASPQTPTTPSQSVDSSAVPAQAAEVETPIVARADRSDKETSPASNTVVASSESLSLGASASAARETAADTPPTPSVESLTDSQLIEELLSRHSKRLGETSDPALPDVIRMRTLQILASRPDEALSEIPGWSSAEREYVNQQMLTLWHLTDPTGHPVRSRRWTTALPSMREASQSLAAATGTLEVRSMQFCQEVLGFGQTVPFESREYFAGQKVILYYEVDNFDAERLTDGYETHLRGSYQILDTNGQLVAEQILQDDLQTCSNFRRDYFIAYVLHLPKRLTPGSYRFELTIEDVKGHAYGQASIPLDVKAL